MTIDTDRAELQALTEIVGEPVVAFERAAWGFENHTAIVTLAEGRQLVVQRIASRSLAAHKLRLAELLPDRMAAAGIRIPRLLTAAATADPPYAVREYIPGVAAATFMGQIEGAVIVAAEMGVLLRLLRNVSTEGAGLHSGWANPARLE
ncbi:MAG TPA: phosphotransferase, partial [Roseiflexaceae bacterium]